MGNVTVTIANPGSDQVDYFGSRKVVFGTLSLSSSYAAGGDAFTLSQFGLEQLSYLDVGAFLNPAATTNAFVGGVNAPTGTGGTAAGTIQAFWSNTSATFLVEASGNLAAYSASFMAIGW